MTDSVCKNSRIVFCVFKRIERHESRNRGRRLSSLRVDASDVVGVTSRARDRTSRRRRRR
jgi:hypothetical protein